MKKTLSIIANVLIWLFVAFAVLTTVLAFTMQNNQDGLPSIGGKCIITILSDSMSPEFEAGDLIISDRLTQEEQRELKVGDIVTYQTTLTDGDGNEFDGFLSHRIVKVNDSEKDTTGYVYYTTKGDNKTTNLKEDTEVDHTKIIAKYSGKKIAGIGKVVDYLKSPTGFLIVIVLPLVLFFLFELYRFIIVIVSNKKAKLSPEDEEMIKQQAIAEYLKQQGDTDEAQSPAEPEASASVEPEAPAETEAPAEPKDDNQ